MVYLAGIHTFESAMTPEFASLLEILILFPPATSQAPSLLEKSTRPPTHLSRVRSDSSFFSSLYVWHLSHAGPSVFLRNIATPLFHHLAVFSMVVASSSTLLGLQPLEPLSWTILINTQTFMPNRIGSFVGVESANTWSAVF